MKHFGKIATGAFGVLALTLASCSNDEPVFNPGNGENGDSDVFATLNLRLPSASSSRAGEENGPNGAYAGIEFGQDSENNVGSILVVLATKSDNGEYKYLTSTVSDGKPGGVTNNEIKYTLNFSANEMSPNPLDKDPDSNIPGQQDVYVFAYCNPTTQLKHLFDGKVQGDTFADMEGNIEDKDAAEIWASNSFLMTNSEISVAKNIPSRNDLVNNHNAPEKAFDLGTVKVKRAAARFDFATYGDNIYTVYDFDNVTELGKVEITHMAAFNLLNKFYYLPRTSSVWNWNSSTGVSTNENVTLCGDLEYGYVVSSNANNFKNAQNLSIAGVKDNFHLGLFDITGDGKPADTSNLDWVSLAGWNKRDEDNNEGWTPNNADYRIWRYIPENTIPGMANNGTASQKAGVTTGVAFKAQFTPAADQEKVWNGEDVIYVHKGIVYGNFAALKAYVEKNPATAVAADFEKVEAFKKVENVPAKAPNYLAGATKDQMNNFKAYAPDADGKYTMYYFYYNRHNSNGNNALMGVNEFGVVRNNVYKLQVTKITKMGDPEGPDSPDTPDESESAYFTVSCYVMPWTVRVNNIEF